MELIVLITTLSVGLSIMLTPCASHQIQVKSHEEQVHELELFTLLPRKLRLMEEATLKCYGSKDLVSYHKKGYLSGEDANMMRARRGTRQEWLQGKDMSQMATMDYSPVRRRWPMHNKSLPVRP